jgi:hypothetical protein
MLGTASGKTTLETILALYYLENHDVIWIQPSKLHADELYRNLIKNWIKHDNIESTAPNRITLKNNRTLLIPTSNISSIPGHNHIIIFEEFDMCRKSNSRLGVRALFDQAVIQTISSNTKLFLFGTPEKDGDMIYIHEQWKEDPEYYSALFDTWEMTNNPELSEDYITNICKYNEDLLFSFQITKLLEDIPNLDM